MERLWRGCCTVSAMMGAMLGIIYERGILCPNDIPVFVMIFGCGIYLLLHARRKMKKYIRIKTIVSGLEV